mgnify:CR=1 FL=1
MHKLYFGYLLIWKLIVNDILCIYCANYILKGKTVNCFFDSFCDFNYL